MNHSHTDSIAGKLQARKILYDKVTKAYEDFVKIEEEAGRLFGYDHPVAREVGYAATYLSNALLALQDYLDRDLPGCNQFTRNSLEQIFDLLRSIKWAGPKNRYEIKDAYGMATKNVAASYGIERNTIADIPVRRLGLEKQTDGFIDLLEKWLLYGDSSGLIRILKIHANEIWCGLIDDFFRGN
jgi:hypothetical protein